MAAYKLYCLDDQGRITSRIEFVGDSDEAAITHVRQHHFNSDCEIWDLGRLVAKIARSSPVYRVASTAIFLSLGLEPYLTF
ncbi:hypothetical protein [Sphingomonas echinoides]|uniref:hypothetical protein n=1 Tax=Sphingomonas echinoides TaxID=59803 RepID=UPI0024136911|nr:hypothetical protein [Sphingomonas echinoides]